MQFIVIKAYSSPCLISPAALRCRLFYVLSYVLRNTENHHAKKQYKALKRFAY